MINSVNKNKHIFIVDDDVSVSKMLSLLLESRGYTVSVAASGEEALNKITSSTDLVLLDLILPDQDGFDVCRKLKEKDDTSRIPIIILSARLFSGDVVEGLYMGADDYLTKPFDCEELIARMEAIMRRASVFGTDGMVSRAEQEIIVELRTIIDEKKIVPFYQPIFRLKPFGILGIEALSRPQTDTMLMNPDICFKAAIQFGVYEELEMVAWRKAVETASGHLKGEKLFLNCNPYMVENKGFMSVVSILNKGSFDPSDAVLEITERTAVVDFKLFYERLKGYKGAGFTFAIDDVGAGFASLETIVETKPEIVKIDRNIVSQLCSDHFKRSIVKFIAGFCKENNIISIAEGVETKSELDVLKEIGVDAVQGYYLYRPMPIIDLEDYKLVQKII